MPQLSDQKAEDRTLVLLIGEHLGEEERRGRVIHKHFPLGNSHAKCGQLGEIIATHFDHLVTCKRCRNLLRKSR